MTDKKDCLIWWTNQADCTLIKAMVFGRSPLATMECDGPSYWPEYLSDDYASRYGRNGRGRLWVNRIFGPAGCMNIEEKDWPETALARAIGWTAEDEEADATATRFAWRKPSYAGIVIRLLDLHHVAALPGIVTDFQIRPVRILNMAIDPRGVQ